MDIKTSFATKKKTTRPDLLGYVHDVLMLKGEEKAFANLFDKAKIKRELLSKFSKLDPIFNARTDGYKFKKRIGVHRITLHGEANSASLTGITEEKLRLQEVLAEYDFEYI
ncbi:4483_t:CDS:1 [Paraglomus occultum]|uniref:4483_t:CDS:1 n=1 Tax=Paraglomus occultum TaxID=144539 RepID=A0A9N9FSS7_9GLOM|nr:4483_t:CDS:1 [Paraglomus occultum]